MNKLLFWINGYVQASVPGKNAERFINILSNHGIKVYQFCMKQERCYFLIDKEKYKLLLPLARKTGSYPKLHKKCGGYYFYKRLLKHTGLYIGIACFSIFLYIMSLFLWDIMFYGNTMHTDEQLLQFVREQGIGFGSRIDKIDCAHLESTIREAYSDIGWVSVELRGSRMLIRVKETAFSKGAQNSTDMNTNIVAEQNGIVTEIITRSGTPMVMAGDTVKAGDILICAWTDTVNEYNETVKRTPVAADGDVLIKSDIMYSDKVPLRFTMKEMTGRNKTGYSLAISDKKIFSYIPSIPYEKYDIITLSVMWKITDNLYLPISHDTIYCMEYEEAEARHSNTNLSLLSYQRYLHVMEQYLQSGYHIIDEQVELQILDDICQLQGNVTLEGPFWHRVEVFQEETEGNTLE